MRYPDIEKLDRTTLIIHVPQFHDYQITYAETLRLTLPNDALSSRTSFAASPEIIIYPFSGSASLDGQLAAGTTEAELVAQPHILIVRLVGNSFFPVLNNMTDPNRENVATDIFTGLRSSVGPAEGEPNAWNTQLATLTASNCLVLLSETELQVTIPALAAYGVSTPETISVVLPATALVAQQPLSAGSFTVYAIAGRAYLSGSLLSANSEATINREGSEIVITLIDDVWRSSIATDAALALQLIAGFTAVAQEIDNGDGTTTALNTRGWGFAIRPYLTILNLRLASPTRLIVSVPQSSAYSIEAPETVSVVLPAAVLRSGRTISTGNPLTIHANLAPAWLKHYYTKRANSR